MGAVHSEDYRVNQGTPSTKSIFLISLTLVIVGVIGYFSMRGHWAFYIISHLGALGVLGLLGEAVALIARRKGYSFTTALSVGLATPIMLGAAAVLVVRYLGGENGQFYCGGSVCLAASILLIIVYSVIKKKSNPVAG